MGDAPQMVVMDVRRVRNDENVHCAGGPMCERWAQYVVTAAIDPRILGRTDYEAYLCREHMSYTLLLADQLKAE
jgi:hypothetical protein